MDPIHVQPHFQVEFVGDWVDLLTCLKIRKKKKNSPNYKDNVKLKL